MKNFIAFVVLLFSVSLYFAYHAYRNEHRPASDSNSKRSIPSKLSVPQDRLDFGTVWATTEFVWYLPITNRGSEPLDIIGFDQSCTCTSVRPESLNIQPGATETVKIRVDLISKFRERTAFQITAKTRNPKGEVETQAAWTISGRVKMLLSFDGALHLPATSILAQPLAPIEITVTATTNLDSLDAETDNPRFLAKAVRIGATEQFKIQLISRSNLAYGRTDQAVTLIPKLAGEILPVTKLRCTGSIERDVELVPATLLGGTRNLSEVWSEAVTVASRTGRKAKPSSCRFDSPDISAEVEGAIVRMTITPKAVGQKYSKGFVRVEGEDGSYELPLEVFWIGQ